MSSDAEPRQAAGQGRSPYGWPELVRYWKSHNRVRGSFDYSSDPDGLANVCQSGAPLAVNRYYHRGQRRVYRSLLSKVPVAPGALALDVGCGAARWSRLLASVGFEVTGIDLQDELITANRVRYPAMRFEAVAIQDFETNRRYDLVSSVTVLQHLPHDEQVRAIRTISGLVRRTGHALLLENIADTVSPVVFANPIARWVELFEAQGFRLVESRRYDYSPALRSYYAATARLRHRIRGSGQARLPEPEEFGTRQPSDLPTWLLRADGALKAVASLIDSVAEPALVRLAPPIPTAHAGMLFRKVGSTDL